MVMNTTTIRNMENYSYDRDTRTLYRGHRRVNPIDGGYILKCREVTWNRTTEEMYEMTKPDHTPLSKLPRKKIEIDTDGILKSLANGVSRGLTAQRFGVSKSTIQRISLPNSDIRKDRDNGMSYLDLCSKYKCSSTTIARNLRVYND